MSCCGLGANVLTTITIVNIGSFRKSFNARALCDAALYARPQTGNHVLTNHGALKSVHLWHTVSDIPPQTYHLKYTWRDCSTDGCMPIGSLYIRNTKACPYAVQGLSWRALHSICKHEHGNWMGCATIKGLFRAPHVNPKP